MSEQEEKIKKKIAAPSYQALMTNNNKLIKSYKGDGSGIDINKKQHTSAGFNQLMKQIERAVTSREQYERNVKGK